MSAQTGIIAPIGSLERPLRVAIVGAGPSGFYAAEALLKRDDLRVTVDIYERLPTPYGLVRYGVAPDHQKIKSVTRLYTRVLVDERVRYFGNVPVGEALTVADLREWYDDVVLTYGSALDRRLDVPGEDLARSWSATEFVGWYNGDPAFQDRDFDLSNVRSVVVIGVGNVAVDVARVLSRPVAELAPTDITSDAVQALSASAVEVVHVLGRRGAAQAKFSPGELKELSALEGVTVTIEPHPLQVDPLSAVWLEREADKAAVRNVELMGELGPPGEVPSGREIRLRFCLSPVELLGDEQGRVRGIVVERNEIVEGRRGDPSPRGTGERFEIPCQAVFRSVGYTGSALDGVPFDEGWGTVPNAAGRVLDARAGQVVPNLYVAGWIKRGPTGLIGTNKGDAIETIECLIEDVAGRQGQVDPQWGARVLAGVRERAPEYFDALRWDALDRWELQLGEQRGKVREKATTLEQMIAATADR